MMPVGSSLMPQGHRISSGVRVGQAHEVVRVPAERAGVGLRWTRVREQEVEQLVDGRRSLTIALQRERSGCLSTTARRMATASPTSPRLRSVLASWMRALTSRSGGRPSASASRYGPTASASRPALSWSPASSNSSITRSVSVMDGQAGRTTGRPAARAASASRSS